ncbi:hypothetical protein ACJ77P_10870 [Syntrophus buswellii]|jgi:hypothetical protein|uniref:hypothetical protein n=1 Tax=Syntrophus buswellii TaxID=43774 RepID=UPI0038D4B0B9
MLINELGIFTQSFTRFLQEQCEEDVWYDLRIKIAFVNGQLEARLDTPPLVETTFLPYEPLEGENSIAEPVAWSMAAEAIPEYQNLSGEEDELPDTRKIAGKGQIITCTNGHEICELSRDYYEDQDVNPDLFEHFRPPQRIITDSDRINEIRCQICGAQWISGGAWNIRFFSEGHWIPE